MQANLKIQGSTLAASMLMICSLNVSAQIIKDSTAILDTANGHGYKILYVTKITTRNVNEKVNGFYKTTKKDFYEERNISWSDAKKIVDSLNKTEPGWYIPAPMQLKRIFVITQSKMDNQRVAPGSFDWQGIHQFYWCLNNIKHDPNAEETVYMCGTINNRDFKAAEVTGSELSAQDSYGRLKQLKLVLIREF